MKNKLAGKIVTFISVLSILLQSFSPFAVLSNNYAYADEMDSASSPQVAPTEAPVLEEVTTTTIPATTTTTTIPELTITPTPEIVDNNEIAVPAISLDPQPSQPLSQWTFEKVELNKEYVAPQNSGVKLIFTKLPENPGNIKIEEITLTEEQIEKTGALSDKAYDITSNMKDGEFSYTLSLPIPESSRGKEVEVKFAEELSKIEEAQEVENILSKTDTSVSVSNLDHLTIFVVVNPAPSGPACVSAGASSGTDCYPTIQQAINAASNNDVINVIAGEYTENIYLNKAVSLIGADKETTKILNTGGAVITIDSVTESMTISGFTIDAKDTPGQTGIVINPNSANITIQDNKILNFTNKGISISNSDTNIVRNNSMIGSSTGSFAGVYIDNGSENNVIEDNIITLATSGGGHLYDVWFTGSITGNNTVNNNIINGGVRGFQQDTPVTGTVTFSNNNIGNTTGPSYAGVHLNGGNAIITDNTIKNSVRPIEILGAKDITITGNTIDGATYSFINIGSYTGTLNPIENNTFLNTGSNILLWNQTANNVDARGNNWGVTDINEIEAVIDHNCVDSPFVHGVCNTTDKSTYGFVRYADIETPVNLGWNVKSKSSTPNEAPLNLDCSIGTLYVNENSVAQNWSAVSGVNIKYQREVTYPSGSIGYFEAGSNNYTNFVTFGGVTGTEGLWKTRVKAYVDANSNNKYDSVEEVSTWSNYCNITFDETPPNTPSFISPENNTITNINAITLKWIEGDDSLSGVKGYTFRYDFYPANGGAVKHWSSGFVPGTQKTRSGIFGHGEGRYEMYVKVTDNAGNVSSESSPLIITYDKTAPDVEITSPTKSLLSGIVPIKGTVTDVNLHHYWLVIENSSGSKVAGPGTVNDSTSFTNKLFFNWDTKLVDDGEYKIKLEARDAAGNKDSGSVDWNTVTVDNTPPSTPTGIVIYKGHAAVTANQIPADGYTNNRQIRIAWNPNPESDVECYWFGTKTNPYHRKVCGKTYYDGNMTPGNDPYYYRVTAIDKAGNESEVATSYQIYLDLVSPDAPIANPNGGDYYEDKTVELTAETDAVIKYTTDGTDPINGTEYTGPITIGVDTTLKAIAIDKAGNVSPVMEEVYEIAPVISGETLRRLNDTSVVLTWTTDDLSTSRVVYDTKSHKVLGAGDNYGYTYTTDTFDEDPNKIKSHSVTITGLTVGTTYYFMPVSHGSPEATGKEIAFTPHFVFGLPGDGQSDGGSDGRSDGGSTGGTSADVLGASTATLVYEGVGGVGGEVLGAETEDEEKEDEEKEEDTTVEETVNDSDLEKGVLGETTDISSSVWQNTFYRWLIIIIAIIVVATLLYFLFFKRKKNKENS